MDDAALLDVLRLSLVDGVGPLTYRALLDHFGSAAAVHAASASDLQQLPRVGPKLARKIVEARVARAAEEELAVCRQHGVTLLGEADPAYPQRLREIPDPPAALYCLGAVLPQDALAIAIVGTRHATRYGLAQAERLAGGLARAGMTIVSGLARGVDGAAHRGALAAGGRTLAVLGSGVLNVYPPEHQALARQVAEQGALLSESPARRPPIQGVFPQRNRVITGLSLGVIVVEAALGSGALISARAAVEQNREVFAVPGRVDERQSHGCHRLIRDGARLVETVDDVLEALGPLPLAALQSDHREVRHPAELQLNELERQVLDAIDGDPTSVERIMTRSGLPIQRVLATISVLETRRVIRRVSGTTVARV